MDESERSGTRKASPQASTAPAQPAARAKGGSRQNVAALVLLLVLIVAGIALYLAIEQRQKIELCIEAGRRDCSAIPSPG